MAFTVLLVGRNATKFEKDLPTLETFFNSIDLLPRILEINIFYKNDNEIKLNSKLFM
jgi:hypothetical protein